MSITLPVAERIRFFDTRRSGNVYLVGHGCLLVKKATIKFKPKGKKKSEREADKFVDTGGAGGSFVEKQYNKQGRVRDSDVGKFTVPSGVNIRFYVQHGDGLDDPIGRLIEGFSVGKDPTSHLKQMIPAGGKCYNYRLSYPHGLVVNVSSLLKRGDVIMIPPNRSDAHVPLTTILRDPRCQNATIHWVACRSTSEGKLDLRNELTGGYDCHFTGYDTAGEPVFSCDRPATFLDDRQELMDSGAWE